MGFITSRFGSKKKESSKSAPSALEQANDPRGGMHGSVAKLVGSLLDVGIDGRGRFSSAREVADAALVEHGGNAEKAVAGVISDHLKLAGASGFLTNVGGFATMVVALPANVLGFYVLATRMSAAVAAVRGYDLSRREIRSAILLSLVGADAQDLLTKAGLSAPTGRLAGLATQRLPGPALIMVNKAVGFRILSQAGRGAFTRFGPTPEFQSALKDPANAAFAQQFQGSQGGGSAAASGVLSDSSFLSTLDERLAKPFLVGFSESMDLVFLVGAIVMVFGFLVMLLLPEVELRSGSSYDQRDASKEEPVQEPAPATTSA